MESNCSKCGVVAPLAQSNISKRTGERLYRSWCKSCEKARKDSWRKDNSDHHNEKCRMWAKYNPDKRKTTSKLWADANKDKVKETRAKWRLLNKDQAKAYVNQRRRKFRNATPKWLMEFDMLFIREIYHLAQLRGHTVDHIIPLQGSNVSGLHVPLNLRLLPASQNYSKSNKFEDNECLN